MSINWVMKDETAKRPFVPLPHERAIISSPPRLSLSLKAPKPTNTTTDTTTNSTTSSTTSTAAPSNTTNPFSFLTPSAPSTTPLDLTSSSGILYLTSRRLVYLPATPTATLQSFSVPLLNLHDTHVTAPWFGPNVLVGLVQPVPAGGLPTPTSPPYMLELKLTFNEGGAYDFHAKFAEVRERLVQNTELVREIGGNGGLQEVTGEQLPAYEEAGRGNGSGGGSGIGSVARGAQDGLPSFEQASSSARTPASGSESRNHTATAPPDEPPPGYDEIAH